MGFGGISIWQLLIIAVIVVLLFGTKKLRGIGGDLGAAVKGFKKALSDEPADAKAEVVMERWLVEDERSHQGKHDYTAEQSGLSEDQLKRDFAEYRERHITA